MALVTPFDTALCDLGAELCNQYPNFSMPVAYQDLLIGITDTYKDYYKDDECIVPNFYCDTVNTTYFCDPI